MSSYSAHDFAVAQRVNRYIAIANAAMPTLTVAEKLEHAWAENIRERERSPEASVSEVGRDADYYFAARKEVANSDSSLEKNAKSALGVVATGLYFGLKTASSAGEAVGLPAFMRTDKDRPNAPVGGFSWMRRGTADGHLDKGADRGPAALHVIPKDD
jgi:hypothetical protein